MDCAGLGGRDSIIGANVMPRWVGGRGARGKGYGVSRTGAGASADLGGSSKYSSENLEG